MRNGNEKNNMRIRKTAICVAAACAALAAAVPVCAKTVKTSDGVLSFEFEDGDDWKEVVKDGFAASYEFGGCAIDARIYAGGDELPTVSAPEGTDEFLCMNVLSSKEETLVVVGRARDEEDVETVRKAVASAELLKKGTAGRKSASGDGIWLDGEKPEDETEAAVEPAILYGTAERLAVRRGPSTSYEAIGDVYAGDAVRIIEPGSKNNGWAKIAVGNVEGYAYAAYLSENPPAVRNEGGAAVQTESAQVQTETSAPAKIEWTGHGMMLYAPDGSAVNVQENVNGGWYSEDGAKFSASGDGSWRSGGTSYTETPPVQE